MIYCEKAEFGQISRSFSLHAEITIKRPKNLTQIGFYPRAPSLDAEHQFTLPSLRSVKSDRLLEIHSHRAKPGPAFIPATVICSVFHVSVLTARHKLELMTIKEVVQTGI